MLLSNTSRRTLDMYSNRVTYQKHFAEMKSQYYMLFKTDSIYTDFSNSAHPVYAWKKKSKYMGGNWLRKDMKGFWGLY